MGMRGLPDTHAEASGPQAQGRVHVYQENPQMHMLQMMCSMPPQIIFITQTHD